MVAPVNPDQKYGKIDLHATKTDFAAHALQSGDCLGPGRPYKASRFPTSVGRYSITVGWMYTARSICL